MTTNNDSRPAGATPVRATAVAGAVLFTDMLLEGLAIPVLPLLPAVVEQGEAATGILFSSYAAAMIVATLFTGRVVDRRGPKGPLLTELIVLVAATLLFATGGPYWLLLVARFVEKVIADNNMPSKTFSTEALNYLTGYEWPGNIRQLENVVESCLVLVPGSVIEVDNLPAEIRDEESQFKSAVDLLPVQLDLADTLEKIEAALIRRALVRADLVQVKAAEYLGISKSLLQYKLKKYGITGH